ncbi:MAG: DsbA family protein [Myxococcota bacterium]
MIARIDSPSSGRRLRFFALVFVVAMAGACADPRTPAGYVSALEEAGISVRSLDFVPTEGAVVLDERGQIGVVAFLDPTDSASHAVFRTLSRWRNADDDIRLAVRLFPLPQRPHASRVAQKWRRAPRDRFFELWRGTASVVVPTVDTATNSAALARDIEEGHRLRIDAMPTVFINGFRLTGAQPVENYARVATAFRRADAARPPLSSKAPSGRASSADGVMTILRPFLRKEPPPAVRHRVRRRAIRPEPDDPWLGAEKPKVTIQFFADLTCSESRAAWQSLTTLVELHPDMQVRFRHRPLGTSPRGRILAKAAIAASVQGKFWPMVRRAFDDPTATPAKIQRWARTLRLNLEWFERDRRGKAVADKLDADRRDGDRLGVAGSPVLVINGVPMAGHPPRARIEDRIAAERERADRLLQAGVPLERLPLETVVRDAGHPVDPADAGPRLPAKNPGVTLFVDSDCPYSARTETVVRRWSKARALPLEVHRAPFDRDAFGLVFVPAVFVFGHPVPPPVSFERLDLARLQRKDLSY